MRTARARSLTAALAIACLTLPAPVAAAGWTESPLALAVGGGPPGAALHGTLTRPDGAVSADAVLIQPGSGPVDRDGNAPGLAGGMFARLAHALAGHGIVSLRIDKRGVGESAGALLREADLSPALYAADLALWALRLRDEPGIRRVFLAGHSEGALIATMAAAHARPAGLILIAGAGRPIADVIRGQLAAAGTPPAVQAEAERIISSLAAGRTVAGPPPALAPLFRESVQPYLIAWFRHDPVAELRRIRTPAVAIQGTADLQIGIEDAKALAGARGGVSFALVPGMNHVLRDAPAGRAANLATYGDPSLPLSSGLVDAVLFFIRSVPAR